METIFKWLFWIGAALFLFFLTTAATIRPHGGRSKEAKILIEIHHLSQAVQAYKERQVRYPPCIDDAATVRCKEQFMQHLSWAFPNTAYGKTVDNFAALNKSIGESWNYNFAKPDGTLAPLNLETLDAAESLVFWLAGFPTPIDPKTKQPVAGRKMFGFHRDDDNPFKRDAATVEGLEPLRFRTDPTFQFDPTRLVDNDGDGWPEYVPITPTNGAPTAPYVYFDADTYANTIWPPFTATCYYPRDPKLAGEWGVCAPISLYIDPTGKYPTRWAKDTSFQIICGGLNGMYGSPKPRVTNFPTLKSYDAADGFQKPHTVDRSELDNLTNLASQNLESAKNAAQQ